MQWTQNNLKEVFDSLNDAVLVIDKEYNIVFVNKVMLDLCQLHEEDVLNRKCYDLAHGCSSHCPEKCISDIICPHSEIFETGNAISIKHTHRMPDGSDKIFHITASPLRDENGNIFGVTEILRDITAGRQTEAFLGEILESMGEGLVVIDRNYRIISANKAYCDQAGQPIEDVVGNYCYEVSHGRDRPCHMNGEDCAAEYTFRTGSPHSVMHTHYEKKGFPHYVELRSYPMLDSRKNVSSVIEIICDVTEKKILGDQLRQAQKMEALGTLTGGIAHDFNNILTAIMGYGNLLQMKIGSEESLRPSIDQILAASEKAANMVQSLLAFSRKQAIKLTLYTVNDIIRGAQELLNKRTKEDVEFRIELTDKDTTVLGDSGQIIQVLMNLVSNASDAMPDGGKLTITTDAVYLDEQFMKLHGYNRPGKYVRLSIADTGTGIDEMIKEKIFDPFFTTKELGKGTGLGLAMSYGIIKQHKGYINVLSEPGRGTTFVIYLPIPIALSEKSAAKTEAHELVYRGTETILVADDNDAVRNIVVTILQEAGFKAIASVDGEDAMDKYLRNKDAIKLLILDIAMPRKNGRVVFEEIKKVTPGMKAILMSGYDSVLSGEGLSTPEGATFISKPFPIIEMLKIVRTVLDA
ncbi:MAG: PAS domain-containing protein [Nitrospiraceae bacterium]|nr:PAS domain-containing protein [Nitrospiraceae bacterium]